MVVRRPRLAWAIGLLGLIFAAPARSEIVMVGRDVNGNLNNSGRNLNPAPGGLGQYVGQFGNGSAVTISPKYFVTAHHVTGSSTFTFNNGGSTPTTYHVAEVAFQGDVDVYKITDPGKSFSVYAPIYTRSDEVGRDLVSVGYGVGRGPEVFTPGTMKLAGWDWNNIDDRKENWGSNTVNAILTGAQIGAAPGDYLRFSFDRVTDAMGHVLKPDQTIFSDHDSGGGTFIKDPTDGIWKLAGVNGDIDAVYDKNGKFVDSIFDTRGFYANPDGTGLISGPNPIPMSSYSSRISSHEAFLAPFLRTVPEPSSLALLAVGLGGVAYAGWRRRAAVRDRG